MTENEKMWGSPTIQCSSCYKSRGLKPRRRRGESQRCQESASQKLHNHYDGNFSGSEDSPMTF